MSMSVDQKAVMLAQYQRNLGEWPTLLVEAFGGEEKFNAIPYANDFPYHKVTLRSHEASGNLGNYIKSSDFPKDTTIIKGCQITVRNDGKHPRRHFISFLLERKDQVCSEGICTIYQVDSQTRHLWASDVSSELKGLAPSAWPHARMFSLGSDNPYAPHQEPLNIKQYLEPRNIQQILAGTHPYVQLPSSVEEKTEKVFLALQASTRL